MVPIALSSIIALAIIVERLVVTRRSRVIPPPTALIARSGRLSSIRDVDARVRQP